MGKVHIHEISYRFIAHLIGQLLTFESMLLCVCCCKSMIYGESDLMSFIVSFVICLTASVILLVYGRKKESAPSRYEAYIVVALSWIFFTVFGMFPYLLGDFIPNITDAFRKTLFQVATCHTSCGFTTDDYNLWPSFTWMLLIFAMVSGGCTGSTSGGVKNLRLIIIAQCIRNQFRQILHPRAVLPVRAGSMFDNNIVTMVLVFFAAYIAVVFIGWTLLMAFGVGFTEAMSTVISAMGNVGPGLGCFGPAFSWAALPDAAKWTLSSLMLIGRLEIFGFLLIFHRSTWRAVGHRQI